MKKESAIKSIAAFLPWDAIMTTLNTPLKAIAGFIGLVTAVFAAYIFCGRINAPGSNPETKRFDAGTITATSKGGPYGN